MHFSQSLFLHMQSYKKIFSKQRLHIIKVAVTIACLNPSHKCCPNVSPKHVNTNISFCKSFNYWRKNLINTMLFDKLWIVWTFIECLWDADAKSKTMKELTL